MTARDVNPTTVMLSVFMVQDDDIIAGARILASGQSQAEQLAPIIKDYIADKLMDDLADDQYESLTMKIVRHWLEDVEWELIAHWLLEGELNWLRQSS